MPSLRYFMPVVILVANAPFAAAQPPVVAKPDAFETLVNPQCSHCRDEAGRRMDLLATDRVLCWTRGYSDGGAIPIRFFLAAHRVISDSYGVFVYDPDAGYARGFAPSYHFRFHGWRNGVMVMRDETDNTLYSCLSGIAFDGPRKGQRLTPVPTLVSDWGYWLKNYPQAVAYHMFDKYKPTEPPPGDNPDSKRSRGTPDPRLRAEERVFGVWTGTTARAYPLAELAQSGIITDDIGGPLLVLWEPETKAAAAYRPVASQPRKYKAPAPDKDGISKPDPGEPVPPGTAVVPPRKVTLGLGQTPGRFTDAETKSTWDFAGRCVDGTLKGWTLEPVDGMRVKWFAWAAEHPETTIYSRIGRIEPPSGDGPSIGRRLPATRAIKTTKATKATMLRAHESGGLDPEFAPEMKPGLAPMELVAPLLDLPGKTKPLEIALVEPHTATSANAGAWKADGFAAVALLLDERSDAAVLKTAAEAATANGLVVYLWVEVGRNAELARERPEWMASLGMHADWQKRFPNVRPPEKGAVAKAWPWVPVAYKESFAAHRQRVERLLKRAPAGFRGLLLNDLQAGPSSCGCGNLQCRWAVDYHVPSTATPEPGAAPKFVAEVSKLVPGKEVIPVWTTECESEDLPAGKRPAGGWGTGLCGDVPCFDFCRQRFAEQWAALQKDRTGPTALLALHREFSRDRSEYGGPAGWIGRAVDYCEKHGGQVSRDRLWLVVQGYDLPPEEAAAARSAAERTGVAAVIVAKARIDQSYEPRIVKAE